MSSLLDAHIFRTRFVCFTSHLLSVLTFHVRFSLRTRRTCSSTPGSRRVSLADSPLDSDPSAGTRSTRAENVQN